MSFFSPSRCVLILGDEGLQIYNVSGLGSKFVDFVPWETVEFESSIRDILIRRCRRKPVVILNDMVEQHYRKERIPKVSLMDRANVLKRRLGVAFPNYKIRAALKMADKGVKKPGDAKSGDPYLFAAIPNSDSVTKTINAVSQSMAPIVGLYLLPVEGAEMVKRLVEKTAKGKRNKAAWTIFVGQHYNGGLRQIVTRGGELALTRMTPIVDTDVEPELWAKEVAGELNATMSYLSRFGYKQSDGLDIIVVANDTTQSLLESFIDIECNLQIYTSRQAASMLGVSIRGQDDLRYVDPVHAAYLGKKTKFQLPMQAPSIERLTKPRKVASLLMLGLLVGSGYFGFLAFQSFSRSIELGDQLTVAVERNNTLKEEYERETEKQKALGFDFKLVDHSVAVFEELERKKMKPLPVLREIGRSLGADLRLDKLSVKLDKAKIEMTDGSASYATEFDASEDRYIMITVATLSFPNTISPDIGVNKINALQERMANNLPDYDVQIIRQVADLSYTGNFAGEAGVSATAPSNVPERYIAEIQVTGDIK